MKNSYKPSLVPKKNSNTKFYLVIMKEINLHFDCKGTSKNHRNNLRKHYDWVVICLKKSMLEHDLINKKNKQIQRIQ